MRLSVAAVVPCVDIRMNVIYILIIRRLNMTIRNIINDFQKKY